ncbi:MAG: aminomethyl transferase, glycine cleavage protein [Bacteroidetes bacterium]|nr:aminomethyl transferase, glycine cleavage protein [Bacteroidota bacterium]
MSMSSYIDNSSPQLRQDIEAEVTAATNSPALVDRSAVGKLRVTGADRLDLLHRMSTNDLLKLTPYSAIGTVFTNDKGRIIDYVRVLAYPDSLLLITSPGREFTLKNWIDKYTIMEDVQLSVVTNELAMYSILGPQSLTALNSLFAELPRPGEFRVSNLGEITCTLDFQNEFHADRINVLIPLDGAPTLVQRLVHESNSTGLQRIGEQAYECYRIVMGIPKEGTELIDSFNPYEVNLHHAISFTKGCYIGQEVIARLDTYQKIQRRLVGISVDRELQRGDLPLPIIKDSEEIGLVTSSSLYPLGAKFIGLGVVKKNDVSLNDMIDIMGQSSRVKGIIIKLFN